MQQAAPVMWMRLRENGGQRAAHECTHARPHDEVRLDPCDVQRADRADVECAAKHAAAGDEDEPWMIVRQQRRKSVLLELLRRGIPMSHSRNAEASRHTRRSFA